MPAISLDHHSASAPDTNYYAAKMVGAARATGEIVVFCDSDCVYTPNWLQDILTAFSQHADIRVVGGETTTPAENAYEIALSMTYIFPRYSPKESLYTDECYVANNVAFRRQFLLDNPIPIEVPTYRGNCRFHSQILRRQGVKIWKHPAARAKHAIPGELSFFFWRFLFWAMSTSKTFAWNAPEWGETASILQG
jgi:glycosyltransferase involved in cell wall biosynthesis